MVINLTFHSFVMKFLKSNILVLFLSLVVLGLTGCKEADENFIHTDNLIHAMEIHDTRLLSQKSIAGTIYEYDKLGNLISEGFTAEEAEGGSGVVVFVVGPTDRNDFDLTNIFITATLTYDEVITPTLVGRHNILVDDEHPDGMVVAVTSGIGTVRKYRIMGIYE